VRLGRAAQERGGDGDADADDDKSDRDGVTHGVILSCTSFEDGRLFVNPCHIDPMAVDAPLGPPYNIAQYKTRVARNEWDPYVSLRCTRYP
jgi:hypothetical protein